MVLAALGSEKAIRATVMASVGRVIGFMGEIIANLALASHAGANGHA